MSSINNPLAPFAKGEFPKSPLKKGDSGGCVFSGYFTTPSPPFLRGILYATHPITCLNKMNPVH